MKRAIIQAGASLAFTPVHAQTMIEVLDYLLTVARRDTMLENLHLKGISNEHVESALCAIREVAESR